jgi:hypothetical protein
VKSVEPCMGANPFVWISTPAEEVAAGLAALSISPPLWGTVWSGWNSSSASRSSRGAGASRRAPRPALAHGRRLVGVSARPLCCAGRPRGDPRCHPNQRAAFGLSPGGRQRARVGAVPDAVVLTAGGSAVRPRGRTPDRRLPGIEFDRGTRGGRRHGAGSEKR